MLALLILVAMTGTASAAGVDTWRPINSGTTSSLSNLGYGDNTYVSLVSDAVLTSPDGESWSRTPLSVNASSIRDIAFGNGTFVAVGGFNFKVLRSGNGVDWTALPDPPAGSTGASTAMYSIIHANNTFYAVGTYGISIGSIASSPDGITWSGVNPAGIGLRGITFGNGLFVAVGSGQRGTITSPDGVTWTAGPLNSADGVAVAYGNNTFVAVGNSGRIFTSPDGETWTQRSANTTNTLSSIAFGGGYFVTVGSRGTILTSTDGISWTSATSGTANSLTKVIYANGTFLAVGASGTILRSGSTTDQGGGTAGFVISGSATGSNAALSLTAILQVAPSDLNRTGNIYLVAQVGNQWFLHNGSTWVPYFGGPLPPYSSGPLTNRSIAVLNSANVTNLVGTRIYVGYGTNEADMVNNGKYRVIHTISST